VLLDVMDFVDQIYAYWWLNPSKWKVLDKASNGRNESYPEILKMFEESLVFLPMEF